MNFTLNGFKQFVEDMDPTPEKNRSAVMGQGDSSQPQKADYFNQLGDEEGIEWADLVKSMEAEPWISSHFKLGGMQHKLSAWKIVPGSLTPDGADIQLKPQIGDRSYLKGNRLNKSRYEDDNRYHLSRKELIKFLTTGWTPAVQQAQGGMPGDAGAMPGMPPAPGGM